MNCLHFPFWSNAANIKFVVFPLRKEQQNHFTTNNLHQNWLNRWYTLKVELFPDFQETVPLFSQVPRPIFAKHSYDVYHHKLKDAIPQCPGIAYI